MSKSITLSNIIMFMLIAVGDAVYILTDALLAKAVTSALFVILGLINAIYSYSEIRTNRKFMYLLLAGLFSAFLGDVLLEIQFVVGAGLFAVGHVFFFISYLTLEKFNWKDLIPGAIVFVPVLCLIVFAPIFNFGGALMEIVAVVYALIISLMVGKAISNLIRKKSGLNIMLVVGSALFFFSDFMLLFNVFAHVPVTSILCLVTYYPAEILLACSILFARDKQEKNEKLNQILNNLKEENQSKSNKNAK